MQKFTKNMLFDEKIGGTIHVAIGAVPIDEGCVYFLKYMFMNI